MILRLRVPAALARVRMATAGTNRRLTNLLVEALRDEDIFQRLLARLHPDLPPEIGRELNEEECLEDHAQRHEDLLRGPWRDS